jgi:hypothetical protein
MLANSNSRSFLTEIKEKGSLISTMPTLPENIVLLRNDAA